MKNKRDICLIIGEHGSGIKEIIEKILLNKIKYKKVDVHILNKMIYNSANYEDIISDLGEIVPLENRKNISYIKKSDLKNKKNIKIISANPQLILNLIKNGYSKRLIIIRVFKPLESRILNMYKPSLQFIQKAKLLDRIVNDIKIFENIDKLESNNEIKYTKVYRIDDTDILDILEIIKYYVK